MPSLFPKQVHSKEQWQRAEDNSKGESIIKRYKPLKRTPIKKVRTKPRRKSPKTEMRLAVETLRDGREICNLDIKEGREEYKGRIEKMRVRQGGRCCLEGYIDGCPGFLSAAEATFEHEEGRGMGGSKRDDRIEVDGKPKNGAAHPWCNTQKGSRFIPYNGT